MEPQLVEQAVLKKLLRNSFNESDSPFDTIITKYSTSLIKDNWFYILIALLIIILIVSKLNKNKIMKEDMEDIVPKVDKIKNNNSKYKEKYNKVSDYYTNTPRII